MEKPLEQTDIPCQCQSKQHEVKLQVLKKGPRNGLDESLNYINEDPDNDYMVDMLTDAWLHNATIEDVFYALYPNDPDLEVSTIFKTRASVALENLRKDVYTYQQEKETVLSVFLANMGPLTQHKARADFAMGFMQVGGFYVANNDGYEDIDQAVEATLFSKAQICCLCSTDDTYPEIVPAFVSRIKAAKPEIIVVLAGYPTDMVETYRQQGIDYFIHLKANVFEVLLNIAKRLGVRE